MIDNLVKQILALDDDFGLFSSQSKPPAAEQIDALESVLQKKLIPEHRAIVERFGAFALVAKESVWPRPKPFETRPRWQFAFAVEVFGVLGNQSVPALEIVAQSEARKPRGRSDLIPAVHIAGDAAVYGYDPSGALYAWTADGEPEPIPGMHLVALISQSIETLARDKARIKADPPKPASDDDEDEDESPVDVAATLARLRSDDADERAEALDDIDRLDEVSVEVATAVTPLLADPVASVRDRAAEVLQLAASPVALEPLLAALAAAKSQHGKTIAKILAAIGACGVGDARAVRALVAHVGVDDRFAKIAAFRALGEMGAAAAEAVPSLQAVAEGADAWHRAQAHGALLAITGDGAKHAPVLIELLDHADAGGAASGAAAVALRRAGVSVVPFLRAAETDARAKVAAEARQLATDIAASEARAARRAKR